MNSNVQSTSNSALAALKDIQLPEPVSFWPLAPGYWVVLILAAIAIFFISWWLLRKRRNTRAKKAALFALTKLSSSDPQFAQQVNTLLKRAVLSYLPRHRVAALDGENWYLLLDSQLPAKNKGQFKKLLNSRFSHASLSQQEVDQLRALAETWLKTALPLDLGNTKLQEALC